MRSLAISLSFGFIAFFLILGLNALSFAQPPAKVLTPAQKEKLKERDRYSRESSALEKAGKLPEAIAAAEKMLALERSIFGAVHEEVVGSLQRLARMHERLEDFAVAQKERREVLSLETKLHGVKAWQLTDARLALSHVQRLSLLTNEERSQLEKAYKWNKTAEELYDQGKYKEAIPLAKQVLEIRQEILGENHPDTANSLYTMAVLLFRQGDSVAAHPYFQQALDIRKKVLGDNHPNTAKSLNGQGVLLDDQGDYAAARLYYEQALAIRKKVLGDNHSDTAMSLNNLGRFLHDRVDYAAARPYYEQALAMYEKVLGDNHPDTARTLNNLGWLLQDQGDFVGARPYFEQALAIYKKVRGDNHPDTAWSLSNLGWLLQSQGDYAAARPYFEQALAIYKKVLGDNHPSTASSLHDMGYLLDNQRDFAGAQVYYGRALAIRKRVLGDNHPATAWTLNNLGWLLFQQGDYAGALPFHEKTLAIRMKVLGENHPDTAYSFYNLGLVATGLKDYEGARSYHEKALAIRQKVLGDNHPNTAKSLHKLGEVFSRIGNTTEARNYLEKALIISRRNLDLAAVAQSERQQLLMGTSLRYQFYDYLGVSGNSDEHIDTTYTHVLAWKGSVLARQQRLRLERQNPQLAPLVAELRSTSSQLATLAFATPDLKKRDVWNRQLEKLTTDKEGLERELAQKSQTFRQDQELKNLTPSKLLELLPADTALVDFLVYGHSQPDPNKKGKWITADRLTAFVLKPGAAIVRLDLGPMAPIEKAIDEWRDSYKKQPGKAHPGIELRRLLWLPLEKHVAGAKTVIISPDGALGRLPFAALPGSKEGSYLLEDVALTVIPVPRLLPALLGKKDEPGKEPSLLLVGDVDFAAAAGKADAGTRVAATGTRSGERKEWKRLPATKGEILVIRDAFEQRFADGKLKILRGEQATQSSLRELASKYSHLHLATHGFFAPPEVRSAFAGDDKDRSAGDLFDKQGVTGFHPGLLSGLVFAGANKPPAPGQSDGILTALEVAELDLSKVELAVLSACETGLGKVAAGEGILGLQRAFQVAGAKSVVASLWSVDDEATRKLMERFYENHWQKNMSKADALRQAQLAMLRGELVRGIVRLDDPEGPRRVPPYYWAAFVLSGDWR